MRIGIIRHKTCTVGIKSSMIIVKFCLHAGAWYMYYRNKKLDDYYCKMLLTRWEICPHCCRLPPECPSWRSTGMTSVDWRHCSRNIRWRWRCCHSHHFLLQKIRFHGDLVNLNLNVNFLFKGSMNHADITEPHLINSKFKCLSNYINLGLQIYFFLYCTVLTKSDCACHWHLSSNHPCARHL
jgi:hypothetical protein